MIRCSICLPGCLFLLIFGIQLSAQATQSDEDAAQVEAKQDEAKASEQKNATEQKNNTDDPQPMVETNAMAARSAGAREIRLFLWDGSVVTGNVSIDTIHVETKFGTLEVPVANIVYLRPGLNSIPELNGKLNQWIEQLGDKEFSVRETAHRELQAMGPSLLNFLRSADAGASAERKKHLQSLVEEIESLTDDESDESGEVDAPLHQEDSITTGQFTIVGQIKENNFTVATRYGDLAIDLKDIKRADRTWFLGGSAVRKTVEIGPTAFMQRQPNETRIRIKPGDQVSIRASGSVTWASWGNVFSTPDGIPNQGDWNGIQGGTLVAKIGKSGEAIKIGTKAQFVAKSSGELILAIAMPDNIASQEGYQWYGNYTAKIVVEPEQK